MSFYANPNVIIHAAFHCDNCGWTDVEVLDDGDRAVSDHRCASYLGDIVMAEQCHLLTNPCGHMYCDPDECQDDYKEDEDGSSTAVLHLL